LFGTHQGRKLASLMCKSSLNSQFRLDYCITVNAFCFCAGIFLCRIKGTEFLIIYHDENQAEISINRNWDPSVEGKAVPLNIDKR